MEIGIAVPDRRVKSEGGRDIDEAMAFLFSDRRATVGNEIPSAIQMDFLDSAIGDHHCGPSSLTPLEKTLIDTAEVGEPQNLSDVDRLVLVGLDCVDEGTDSNRVVDKVTAAAGRTRQVLAHASNHGVP